MARDEGSAKGHLMEVIWSTYSEQVPHMAI